MSENTIDLVGKSLKSFLEKNTSYKNNFWLIPPLSGKEKIGEDVVSIHLYQIKTNNFLKNKPDQFIVNDTETYLQYKPTFVDLFYVITPWLEGSKDPYKFEKNYDLIQEVIQAIHDEPVMSTEVESKLLENQNKNLRLYPQEHTMEELNHLWGMFSVNFRLSYFCKITPVAIMSKRKLETTPVIQADMAFGVKP